MPPDSQTIRSYLLRGDFRRLFTQELGWDRYGGGLSVAVGDQTFNLEGIAQKRGAQVFLCSPDGSGRIPPYAVRQKVDREVAKSAREHLIIFADASRARQAWQWVARGPGRPASYREYRFEPGEKEESLAQKLAAIAIPLSDEEELTLTGVVNRLVDSFDRDPVTKRFYERFKKEHDAFLGFIRGIPDVEQRRWYASVMLNRLMFIYFVQKKGFLDGNLDYLRVQLGRSQARAGDRFHADFLCPLFFAGFAKRPAERTDAERRLLGDIPYLDGGLFQRHQIEEQHGQHLDIADESFAQVFAFFEQYEWHLDDRPLAKDSEINPDVLGYIFEKYINQKQMGAYYTKEDITEYIGKNTVVPYLFDAARRECRIAFEGESAVWRLAQEDPDRYIYPSVRHGVELPLPPEIAAGLKDVSQRGGWNKPAPREYALPTEIWREVVARRQRYEEVWSKLVGGEVRAIDDFITYNLNIRQFAQDVIENCEGPELLRAFWKALNEITVLDPTCGSGAFLFAALNILEPLYEACLNRMQAFLDDLAASGEKHSPAKYGDFQKALARLADHPNRRYFILKTIMVNNLYGVDIMEEAVEICKLRLFLKLVAQVESADRIEPLPDIDFNIRAGNTLVGFATYEDVKRALTSKMDFDNALPAIEEKARAVEALVAIFREQQLTLGGRIAPADKAALRHKLGEMAEELNRYLAREYGVESENSTGYADWLASHRPFHWFVEFHGIMAGGGFGAVIGNPPYVELPDVGYSFMTSQLDLQGTGNLYALCLERASHVLRHRGLAGLIVPISAISTPRMLPLMKHLDQAYSTLYIANFAVRPGKLFVGVDMNLTTILGRRSARKSGAVIHSTGYTRWRVEYRNYLFESLTYAESWLDCTISAIPKIGSAMSQSVAQEVRKHHRLASLAAYGGDQDTVYYHSGGRYFRKCLRDKLSNAYKALRTPKEWASALICVLSSGLFYLYWLQTSDCYHVTANDINTLPVPARLAEDKSFDALADELLEDLYRNAARRLRNRADGTQQVEVNFNVGKSKLLVDLIDRRLVRHYGFTGEQLDYIINYDIKYRLGQGADEGEE
ncbi:MAG: hypothetical protein M1401_09115 [Chloroflexi bacterium]|nr:hypothetical protein [Chloroflexota bacterium]